MSLIIALGSNLGDSKTNFLAAKEKLQCFLNFIAQSRIYSSKAVDYEAQPDFFNQVMEFELPKLSPSDVMRQLLAIEKELGRSRDIPKGPRTLDLDIILWALETHSTLNVTIPHPRWLERSFVVRPFQELPFFKTVEKCFTIPQSFKVEAFPISG